MTDEELLAMLSALDTDPIDPRLDRLAEGVDSDADLTALQAALADAARHDPQMQQDLALFMPLDAQLDAEIAEQVLAQATPVVELDANAPAALSSPAQLEPPRRAWLWASLAAAATVLIAVLALRPGGPTAPDGVWRIQALSGQKLHRDKEAAQAIYGPGSTVKLVLRPQTAPSGPVQIAAWWIADDVARPLDPKLLSTQPNGVSVFSAPIEAFEPAHLGRQQLVLLVGAPDSLPKARQLSAGALLENAAWQSVPYTFERRSSP
jgi:hypothetical protein